MLGQGSFSINIPGIHADGFGLAEPMLVLHFAYYVAIFAVAWRILTRNDFDTQNKILWLIVVVLVPLGLVLYMGVAPVPPVSPQNRITPGSDVSGTPWAGKPGHTKR